MFLFKNVTATFHGYKGVVPYHFCGFTSLVLKMEGYFLSKMLTSAGTECGMGCNYFGPKADKTGECVLDGLVTLTNWRFGGGRSHCSESKKYLAGL